jgi:hypothetical protein
MKESLEKQLQELSHKKNKTKLDFLLIKNCERTLKILDNDKIFKK